MLKRALLVLLVACGLVSAGASAPALAVKPSAATFTVSVYDNSGGALPTRTAIRLWSQARANVNIVQVYSPCSGSGCIIVSLVDAHSDGTCFASTAGCAYLLPDGTCQVEVARWIVYPDPMNAPYQSRWLPQAVTVHEVGHCLGLPHSGDPASIMYNPASSTDPVRRPSAADLALLRELWADGYQPPAV